MQDADKDLVNYDNADALEKRICNGMAVNAVDDTSMTLLHYAADENSVRCMKVWTGWSLWVMGILLYSSYGTAFVAKWSGCHKGGLLEMDVSSLCRHQGSRWVRKGMPPTLKENLVLTCVSRFWWRLMPLWMRRIIMVTLLCTLRLAGIMSRALKPSLLLELKLTCLVTADALLLLKPSNLNVITVPSSCFTPEQRFKTSTLFQFRFGWTSLSRSTITSRHLILFSTEF